MITVKNLRKSFGARVLFDGFDFSVSDGELVTLTGQSGCGKTTLLNIIGGIESFDGGEIVVGGAVLRKKQNLTRFFGETVGFLFQNFVLVQEKTIEQNLNLIQKKNRTTVTITEALERVGLAGKERQKIYTLSGGEQQRVALARLLMKKCEVVLADEPTGSLDRENAAAVMEILNGFGKTTLVVTHDPLIAAQGHRCIALGTDIIN